MRRARPIVQLEQVGDRDPLLGGPVMLLPSALLPSWVEEPNAEWVRGIFRNGRHRFLGADQCGVHDVCAVAERIAEFDEWVQVGRVVAVTDFDMKQGNDQTCRVIGLARLASTTSGPDCRFEGQRVTLQRWVNLRMHRA